MAEPTPLERLKLLADTFAALMKLALPPFSEYSLLSEAVLDALKADLKAAGAEYLALRVLDSIPERQDTSWSLAVFAPGAIARLRQALRTDARVDAARVLLRYVPQYDSEASSALAAALQSPEDPSERAQAADVLLSVLGPHIPGEDLATTAARRYFAELASRGQELHS